MSEEPENFEEISISSETPETSEEIEVEERPQYVEVYLDDGTFLDKFENELTLAELRELMKERNARKIRAKIELPDGTSRPVNASDFPVQAPAKVIVQIVEKVA